MRTQFLRVLLVTMTLLVALTVPPAWAQGGGNPPKAAPVQVVNTPLPVTGTVSVTALTPLSVTGTVAVTTSTPLQVTGSVTAAAADNPAFFPLRLSATGTVPAGFVGSFGNTLGSAVPADRRYVIEYVSFWCASSGSVEVASLTLSVAEKLGEGFYSFHSYPVPLTKMPANYSGMASSVGAQSLRLYSDGGQALQFGVTLSAAAPTGGLSCNASVSGYTVPMQ